MRSIQFTVALTFFLLGIQLTFAQNQALIFDGTNQYMTFDASGKLPQGNINRTVQFWLKTQAYAGAEEEPLVILGDPESQSGGFGIIGQFKNGKRILGVRENQQTIHDLIEIKDEKWHFVAFVLKGNTINAYLDGELTAIKNLSQSIDLTSSMGYVGGFASSSSYYKGAIDNLSIWNLARTQNQIREDMRGYPVIQGDERGLGLYFPFDESLVQQMGNPVEIQAQNTTITGMLENGANWTEAIPDNPTLLDEGIWFVIQNKVDIDNDFDIPANRMALKAEVNSGTFSMEEIPLTGNHDAFLWRIIPVDGQSGSFQLINKAFEGGKVLGYENGVLQILAGDPQGTVGNNQRWEITHKNKDNMGTNVYGLRNTQDSRVMDMVNLEQQTISFSDEVVDAPNQAWYFQPMGLQMGYHIPNAPETIDSYSGARITAPFTKMLVLDHGFTSLATNTSSEWAMLNAHLIHNNMMNALSSANQVKMTNYLSGQGVLKATVLTSKFDANEATAAYPLFAEIFNLEWIKLYRGGAGNDPSRNISFTWFTEEMMWKEGVFNRPGGTAYREFEQAVHEFAHTIDVACGLNTRQVPQAGGSAEWYPWQVQYWFNSAQSAGAERNRAYLAQTPASYNYVASVFREENTWLPSTLR